MTYFRYAIKSKRSGNILFENGGWFDGDPIKSLREQYPASRYVIIVK